MNDLIIETKKLTKIYGNQKSVSELSLHVRRGRIYGLLGRNGAGKTTTMKMLLGLTKPTSGKIRIFGEAFPDNPGLLSESDRNRESEDFCRASQDQRSKSNSEGSGACGTAIQG